MLRITRTVVSDDRECTVEVEADCDLDDDDAVANAQAVFGWACGLSRNNCEPPATVPFERNC